MELKRQSSPPPVSTLATRHEQLRLRLQGQFGFRLMFWLDIGILAGLVGWYQFFNTFNLSNSSKVRVLMFIYPITLVLSATGLKLSWRTIGRWGVCIVYLFSVSLTVIVGHLQPAFNMDSLIMVTCITAQMHALGQLLRLTRDTGILDILLGAVMQLAIYVTFWKDIYAFVAVSVICAGAILHKFFTHPAPSP